MSKYLALLMITVVSVTIGCKQKTGSLSTMPEKSEETFNPFSVNLGGNYGNLQTIRLQTKALIEDRIEKDGNAQASLTFAWWYPEFVFNKTMSDVDQYKGYWIKFEDDFKYTYGVYDVEAGRGQYHYRLDDSALVMLDEDESFEPKYWQVKHNGSAMALVGSHDLAINNGMQMKLLAEDQRPIK